MLSANQLMYLDIITKIIKGWSLPSLNIIIIVILILQFTQLLYFLLGE